MIKSGFLGKVEIRGPEAVVMTELSMIITELRKVLTKKYGAAIAERKLRYVFEELSRMKATEEDDPEIEAFMKAFLGED